MKINFNKFKAISDLFKTPAMKEEEIAVKNFYEIVLKVEDTSNNKIDDLHILINNYLTSGFKIKKSHKSLIGCEPFEYILKNINSTNALEVIWNNGFDNNYKKEIQENNILLVNYGKFLKLKNTSLPLYHLEGYFKSEDILFSYLENIANPAKLNTNKVSKSTIENVKTYCSQYPSLYKEQLEILSNLNKRVVKHTFVHTPEDLVKIFQGKKEKTKISKNTDESYSDKTLLSMVSTLKLYENKFTKDDEVEKFIFNEILSNITDISKKKLAEHSEESLYINSVLHKHLPELLSDFFEIPEKIRTTYKDQNNRTPKDVFCETLKEINTKISQMTHNIFDENFINLKVKQRVMKQK